MGGPRYQSRCAPPRRRVDLELWFSGRRAHRRGGQDLVRLHEDSLCRNRLPAGCRREPAASELLPFARGGTEPPLDHVAADRPKEFPRTGGVRNVEARELNRRRDYNISVVPMISNVRFSNMSTLRPVLGAAVASLIAASLCSAQNPGEPKDAATFQ